MVTLEERLESFEEVTPDTIAKAGYMRDYLNSPDVEDAEDAEEDC